MRRAPQALSVLLMAVGALIAHASAQETRVEPLDFAPASGGEEVSVFPLVACEHDPQFGIVAARNGPIGYLVSHMEIIG
jgi:hypothetical protein